MARRKEPKRETERGIGRPIPRRIPRSVYSDAQALIEMLIENDRFVPDTVAECAARMGWFRPSLGALDRPDVDRVNDASRLTQDLILTDDNRLGGYVICYKPNVGGMVLIDPDQPLEDVHVIHVLVGDLQNQQRIKTINRRRLADWRQAGQSFASGGDMDMARLFWKAEEQVDTSGFVDDPTVDKIFKQLRARELVH